MDWDQTSFVDSAGSLIRGSSHGRETSSLTTPVDDIPQQHFKSVDRRASPYSVYTPSITPDPEDDYRHGIVDRLRRADHDHPRIEGSYSPRDKTIVLAPGALDHHGSPKELFGCSTDEDRLSVEGSYFSEEKSPAPATLESHSSAKELINRYESISKPQARRQVSSQSTLVQSRMLHPPSETTRSLRDMRDKSRSPLRRSFQNLMAVFGKKGKQKEEDTIISTRYLSPASTPQSQMKSPVPSLREKPFPSIPLVEETILRSGSMLHLCEPLTPTTLPVWNNRSARLTSSHMLLEWRTVQGNPCNYSISLVECSDVRSISTSEIETIERNMLPDPNSGYVFELTFNGRTPERFAANSVADRSGWVSAIWDALLLCQESNVKLPPSQQDYPLPSIDTDSIVIMPEDCQDPCDCGHPLDTTTVSSPSPPVTPPRDTSIVTRKTPSPSIRNLSNMSVVKSRLAQMHHYHSDISGSSGSPGMSSRLTSPPFSPFSRAATSEHRGWAKRPITLQDPSPSRRTIVNDDAEDTRSIIDLYREKTPSTRFLGLSPVSEASESPFVLQAPPRFVERSYASTPRSLERTPTPTPQFHARTLISPRAQQAIGLSRALPAVPETRASDVGSHTESAKQQDDVRPLMTLIQDHAMEQYNQTTELGNKIASLQDDMRGMSKELQGLLADQPPGESELRTLLEDLCSRMDRVTVHDDLKKLDEKMDSIKADLLPVLQLRNEQSTVAGTAATNIIDGKALMEKIEETRVDLKADLPAVLEKLNALAATTNDAKDPPAQLDLSQVGSRLGELLQICKRNAENSVAQASQPLPTKGVNEIEPIRNVSPSRIPTEELETTSAPSSTNAVPVEQLMQPSIAQTIVAEQIQSILSALQDAKLQQESQVKLQTDSARYLNELNSWLEKFVNSGSAQTQSIASTVQQLCRELGVLPQDMQDLRNTDRKQAAGGPRPQNHGLINDVRSLLAQNAMRDAQAASLESSVQQLVVAVRDDLKKNDNERQAFATQTVVGLIDRQRQEQETMLRNIAAELSNDIRGERLRFVEAMKEATAINVQLHVEEFKKELSREVMMMTTEVGRLQRERQALEQQIADLFSFMAKQRGDMNKRVSSKGTIATIQGLKPPAQSQHHHSKPGGRPLPIPGNQIAQGNFRAPGGY